MSGVWVEKFVSLSVKTNVTNLEGNKKWSSTKLSCNSKY